MNLKSRRAERVLIRENPLRVVNSTAIFMIARNSPRDDDFRVKNSNSRDSKRDVNRRVGRRLLLRSPACSALKNSFTMFLAAA